MSSFPSCVALFQGNRRHKRTYGAQQPDKVSVMQVIGVNESTTKGGDALQSITMGSKENFIIGLSKTGQVYIWGEFSTPIPLEEGSRVNQHRVNPNLKLSKYFASQIPEHLSYFKNVKISQIACSDDVALFLSNEGTLYAWGDDSDHKFGVLGLGQQYKAQRPCPNSQLFDYMIKTISLAETHACAVDSSGRLFCWGFGPNGELGLDNSSQTVNIPTMITKQKSINIKKAVCHNTYTAFCSGAGYVFLFGVLSSQGSKMLYSSQSKSPIGQSSTQPFGLLKSNSQINLDKRQNNPLMQSSNRPLNAMTQIMGLSETFISDIVGGETFLICLTSSGDVYFVDDSLDSVQINTVPVESVAVAGSKILGLAKGEKLFEWSTAGLNKLSFNKENKMLLRQDFQIKEYKLRTEFAQNTKLCSLQSSKQLTALVFDDISNVKDKYLQLLNDEEEVEMNQEQIVIADLQTQPKNQHQYNLMNQESSIQTSPEDQKEDSNPMDASPLSFQNDTTPEVSITAAAHDFHLPSFRITEEHQMDYQPSHFLSEKDISNIFNYNNPQIIRQPQKPQPVNQFFTDVDNNSQIPYRPSSIKSYNPTSNQSHSSQYNNSNNSLKQCAADMNPLGKTNQIEISFPSFLNLSNDRGQGKSLLEQERSQSMTKQEKEQFQAEQNIEFSIKLFPQRDKSMSESGSREASIVRHSQQNEDGDIEESMVITLDSFQIKAKQTTTPKRILGGYTQSKRGQTMTPQSNQNPMDQSELSNEFNITAVMHNEEERNSLVPQQIQRISNPVQYQQQSFEQTNAQQAKKLSNSAGSHIVNKKRSVFMQAILSQQKKPFDLSQNPTSVTQILKASPLDKDSSRVQDQISEEDMNLVMSQSNDESYHEYYDYPLQCQPQLIYRQYNTNPVVQQQPEQQRVSTNQTEDNFEVDYSLSNSCTPKSSQSIIRRINFDDTTYDNGGQIVKISENEINSYISSFRMSNAHAQQNREQQIDPQNSSYFIQYQSPILQQMPMSEQQMNYFQGNSTPNNPGEATQIMMLTEEKFKNLKTEISQVDQHNQLLITQNTLLSSPLLNDFHLNKVDSKSMLFGTQFINQSQVQNLSSFIKNNKYLQVYENFRQGFILLNKMQLKNKAFALRKIKRVTHDQKQKSEFVQGLAKFLFNTLRTHILGQKQAGFKRIKKFYKERQLQVYINQKHSEFAIKTKVIQRVANIISDSNQHSVINAFSSIKHHFMQQKREKQDKMKKGLTQIFNIVNRKCKQVQEKSVRTLQNWGNQKRILCMNFKLLARVLTKVQLRGKRKHFRDLKQSVELIQLRQNSIRRLMDIINFKDFEQFKLRLQEITDKEKAVSIITAIFESLRNKNTLRQSIQKLKYNSVLLNRTEKLVANFTNYQSRMIIRHGYQQLKKNVAYRQKRDQQLQVQKAMLLLIFNNFGEMIRQSLRTGFKQINDFSQQREDTFLVNKSEGTSNHSFHLNMLSDNPSLILTRKEPAMNNTYYSQGGGTSRNQAKAISKKCYQTNVTQDKIKRPTLNDYLSFSPQNAQEQMNNKFQSRRKTEASVKPKSGKKKFDKSYMDCPLPLQCHQERTQKTARQFGTQGNKLNVSIKDLNQAFKDQISKIKEKQEDTEEEEESLSLHSQEEYMQFHETEQQEINTPEELILVNPIDKNLNTFGGTKSPILNPLCTSESYYLVHGAIGHPMLETGRPSLFDQPHQQRNQPSYESSTYSENSVIKQYQLQAQEEEHENVHYMSDNKFCSIHKTENPVTFRQQQQSSTKKKGDSRYQQHSEKDFSMDFEQSQGIFDEFEQLDLQDQHMQRLASDPNIDCSQFKTIDQDKYDDIDQLSAIMHDQKRIGNITTIASPKFNESFLPPFSKEAFNELAAQYKMMELTPETDLKNLLHNKSIFKQEESIYSQNQYADPVEMALSPRNTVHTQNNEPQQQQQEQRPYDFEFSTNSKFKIISQNQVAQSILNSQSAEPSSRIQTSGICKKLTFGYDLNKSRQQVQEQQRQKNTLYVSNGEQSINFNLTQEDEEEEEMDVGEEIPTEKRSRVNLALPESRIMQQEQQEEKNIMLSYSDLRTITQNRMQKLNNQNRFSRERSMTNRNPQQDFISQNIERLRNVIKLSPRYDMQQNDQYNSNASSRNLSTRSIGFFNVATQHQSFESQPNYASCNQSKVMQSYYKPLSTQQCGIRSQSKENSQIFQQPPPMMNVRDSCSIFMQQKNSLPGPKAQQYQPLTQRGHSSSINQWERKGMMDRRVSCEQQEVYMTQQEMKGSFSQRNLVVNPAQASSKSRNKNEKLSTFLTMGAKMMTQQSDSTRQSYNTSSFNMRHFQ